MGAVAAAVVAGLACPALVALEGVVRPEVTVDQFRLEPYAKFLTADGRFQFHPKGLLGLGVDSNVYAVPEDETADGFVRALAGFEGRYASGLFDLVVYDLEIDAKLFFQESDRNHLGGRMDVEWVHEGIEFITSSKLHWERIDDPLVETGERIQRSEYGAGVEFGRVHPFGEWVVEATAGRNEYHEDGRTFKQEERSNLWGRLGAGYTRKFSKTGKISGEGYLQFRSYDEGDRFNDNVVVGALARWRGRMGKRSSLEATGGFEGRFYSDDFLGQSSYDDAQVFLPVATILARWQYRAFSRVDVQIYSRGQDSSTANASWIYGISSEWMHAFDERWRAGGYADFSMIRNSGAAAGQPIDQRRNVRIGGKCELELVRGIGTRFRISYTSSDAEVSSDFDRLEAVLEAAVAF